MLAFKLTFYIETPSSDVVQNSDGMFVDVLNAVCEREDSMGRKPKFDYESFVELMKEVDEKYSEDFVYCMPEYLSYNKRLKKIQNEETRNFLMERIKENKIILTGNGKEEDDQSLVSIAMSLERPIMSKDKRMKKHIESFSEEIMPAAIRYIEENRTDFHFINGNIAIDGLIPRKFKVNT